MFSSLLQDARRAAWNAAKLAGVSMLIGLLTAAALFFLTLAAFIWAENEYGMFPASLGLGILFLLLAIAIFAIVWLGRHSLSWQREPKRQALRHAENDVAAMEEGIEMLRAMGGQKILPALVLGAVILGAIQALSQPKSGSEQPN